MPDSLNFKKKYAFYAFSANSKCVSRAVIKSLGQGFPPGCYYERGPQLVALENRRKTEPKEIISCLIPRLLVVFTQQHEILVTTLVSAFGQSCIIRARQVI